MTGKTTKIVLTMVVVLSVTVKFARSEDQYLEESQGQCSTKKDVISCAKYRVLKYITNYTENSFFEGSFGPLRMTRYDEVDGEEESLFSGETPRFLSGYSEVGKFFNFVRRQVDHFLNRQSLLVSLPEGARFISLDSDRKGVDSRGKKKKADLLISLLTLFKVFKIKVLVALALAGILVIKKVLLVGAFILPSVIHNLKMSCMKAAAGGGYHHVTTIEADHEDFGNGFGAYGGNNFGGQYGGQFGTQYGGQTDKFGANIQRRQ
nr:uncharacterized protein LOC111427106 [Onthophagus taurus]